MTEQYKICFLCEDSIDVCYVRDSYEYEINKRLIYRWICRSCIAEQREEINMESEFDSE